MKTKNKLERFYLAAQNPARRKKMFQHVHDAVHWAILIAAIPYHEQSVPMSEEDAERISEAQL